jgi:hypothetical protein
MRIRRPADAHSFYSGFLRFVFAFGLPLAACSV